MPPSPPFLPPLISQDHAVTFPGRQLHPAAMSLHVARLGGVVGQSRDWEPREAGAGSGDALPAPVLRPAAWSCGSGMGVGKPGHPGGWRTAALPPAPFRTGGQHPFCQHLPPMMLFSAAHRPWPPSLLSHLGVYRGLPAGAKPCHKHILPAEAGASPMPMGQFGSCQAPMASGSVSPPPHFSLLLLATPCLHPIPLPLLGGGCDFGQSASSPSRCHGVCSPACIQHAALASSHTALHHVHCSLTAAICKTAFPPRILTFSPLLFSLPVFLVFFSPHSPAAHPR